MSFPLIRSVLLMENVNRRSGAFVDEVNGVGECCGWKKAAANSFTFSFSVLFNFVFMGMKTFFRIFFSSS